MNKSRRRAFKIFILFFTLISCWLAGELVFFTYYSIKAGHPVSATQIFSSQQNKFVGLLTETNKCTSIDQLFPHPYLEFVYHQNFPCARDNINATGFPGREFPLIRDQDRYTIFLTGGSVAAFVGGLHPKHPKFLEEELNSCYKPPHGTGFTVLNAAIGGWKQPQQAIAFLLYGDIADALVTLEGFNEISYYNSERIEKPHLGFQALNPLTTGNLRPLAAAWLVDLLDKSTYISWLRYSFLYQFTIKKFQSYLADKARKPDKARQTTAKSLFALPAEWTIEQRQQFNLEQHKKYLLNMSRLATGRGIPAVFFLQPVPALDKLLTDEEKNSVGKLWYGDLYRKLEQEFLSLRKQGVRSFSLVNLFHNFSETLYIDSVHVRFEKTTGESYGNRKIAKAMATNLGQELGWQSLCN